MIITLILIALFVISVGLYIKAERSWSSDELLSLVGMAVFGVFLVTALSRVLIVNFSQEVEYEKMLNARDIIEYRLELIEQDELDTFAEIQLYNDITEYNRIIIHTQRWANNPWTSWFHNQKIGKMDVIVLPELHD